MINIPITAKSVMDAKCYQEQGIPGASSPCQLWASHTGEVQIYPSAHQAGEQL